MLESVMLRSLESAQDYSHNCRRPVSRELYEALGVFRNRILEEVSRKDGEYDETLDSTEYYFRTVNRIIGVRVPAARFLEVAGFKIRLPEKSTARIGLWGMEMNNEKMVGKLIPLSLPLRGNIELKSEEYGYIDSFELRQIKQVIITGTQIKREEFDRIRLSR